jgi:hypothetical protein
MKKIHVTIIGCISVVFALATLGFASMGVTETNSPSNIATTETLSIALLTTQFDPNEPQPLPVRLGEHGKSMSEDEIKSKTSFELSKFKDTADIKIDGKQINLLDTRLRTNGAVYYYYGPDIDHGDSTTLMDFMNAGGIIVKTSQMKNPEAVFSSLANFEGMQGKTFSVNGIVAHGDEANGISPSIVYLYPGDDRIVSVWANASLEDTIKIAEKLDLENHGLDLSKYTDENWTDGNSMVEPSDEVLPVEPPS